MKRLLMTIALAVSVTLATAAEVAEGRAALRAGDVHTAVRIFQELAKNGDAEAQRELGYHYSLGLGVVQDEREGYKWYLLAAEQGLPSGQYAVGLTYEKGQGVKQDFREAAKWYRKAADQGYFGAQSNLGWLHQLGQGVSQDLVLALALYNVADINAPTTAGVRISNKVRLDLLTKEMTREQLVDAITLTRELSRAGGFAAALDDYMSKN